MPDTTPYRPLKLFVWLPVGHSRSSRSAGQSTATPTVCSASRLCLVFKWRKILLCSSTSLLRPAGLPRDMLDAALHLAEGFQCTLSKHYHIYRLCPSLPSLRVRPAGGRAQASLNFTTKVVGRPLEPASESFKGSAVVTL